MKTLFAHGNSIIDSKDGALHLSFESTSNQSPTSLSPNSVSPNSISPNFLSSNSLSTNPPSQFIPTDSIDSVVCFTPSHPTFEAIKLLASKGIPLNIINHDGTILSQISPPATSSVQKLIKQVSLIANDSKSEESHSVAIAKNMVAARIRNSHRLFSKSLGNSSKPQLDKLYQYFETAKTATSMGQLRGIEGNATELIWQIFGERCKNPTFTWKSRTRRPPKDPINAVLSLLSTLWTIRCESALVTAGLDPRFGILHSIRPGRASLACDLIEELRPALIESETLSLFNRGQLSPSCFSTEFLPQYNEQATLLNSQGRRIVLSAYHQKLETELSHPDRTSPITFKTLPLIQAQRLATSITTGQMYNPWTPK